MAKRLQVCRNCKRFTTERVCPSCKSTNLSTSWKGVVVITDVESETAKMLNIIEPGRYALYVG
ncbi:MAG: transcription elongation factor Spt4 [Candidatus Aenigmarchaeota archaeon]|nr:transcription elongation factor Spt4 [Candidatus Aenigmarchaeota archaeon]